MGDFIFLDEELIFSKSYIETSKAEYLDIEIPPNAKTITLQVYQEYPEGSRGNHACFFGEPIIIKDSSAQSTINPVTNSTSDNTNQVEKEKESGMSNFIKILLIIFAIWNLFVFVAFILEDKCIWLIEDKTLLIFSALLGAVGALAYMLIFREKTDELKFKIGVPFFLIVHIFIALIIFLPDFRNLLFQNLFSL